jgi:hypothetical protein
VYEVMGWRLKNNGTAVVVRNRTPDGYWYGNRPELLGDVRGPGVDAVIERIEAAVKAYPYPDRYHVWPGPNSNTFTAHLLRSAPELRVDLPPTAIGKDYLGWRSVNTTPSGTGGQASLFGMVGVAAARGRRRGESPRLQFRGGSEKPFFEAAHRRPRGPARDDTPMRIEAKSDQVVSR